MTSQPAAKVKACKQCGSDFVAFNTLQKVCSPACAIKYSQNTRQAEQEKAFNAETRRRKNKLNQSDRKWLRKELKRYFNRFINLRDAARGLPCITCGQHNAEPINGTLWDAGHFLTVGSHPELEFCEFNVHREHARCNRGAAKSGLNGRTQQQAYEANLRTRIGDELVDWLKNRPYEPAQYTVDEYQWLIAWYKQQCKEFEQ